MHTTSMVLMMWLVGCASVVPYSTQQDMDLEVAERDRMMLIADTDRFDLVLNSNETKIDLDYKITPELLRMAPIEYNMQIVGYGTIKKGELISYTKNASQTKTFQDGKLVNINTPGNAIQIVGDYLYVSIIHGGGFPIHDLTICDLVWDGSHTETIDGQMIVNLVFSFKNMDVRRAIIGRQLRFDLTPLKVENANQVEINLLGYHHRLVYNY